MPYPSQVTFDGIINAAADLIEANGVDQLTLARLAKQLGIKAPSLYRYVESKEKLLRAVNTHTTEALLSAIQSAHTHSHGSARERLLVLGSAYREFALAHPQCYLLAFNNTRDELRPDEAYIVQLVLPVQELFVEISGEARVLTALRGAFALLHGYAMLGITNQLRRGGDLTQDFQAALEAYLAGWESLR